MNNKEEINKLAEMISDGNFGDKVNAEELLQNLDDSASRDKLAEMISDGNFRDKVNAEELLQNLDDSASRDKLAEMISDGNFGDKVNAEESLNVISESGTEAFEGLDQSLESVAEQIESLSGDNVDLALESTGETEGITDFITEHMFIFWIALPLVYCYFLVKDPVATVLLTKRFIVAIYKFLYKLSLVIGSIMTIYFGVKSISQYAYLSEHDTLRNQAFFSSSFEVFYSSLGVTLCIFIVPRWIKSKLSHRPYSKD